MFQLFFLSFSLFFNFSFFNNYQYFFYLNIQRFVENILGTLSLWLAGLWLANLTATAMSHRPPPLPSLLPLLNLPRKEPTGRSEMADAAPTCHPSKSSSDRSMVKPGRLLTVETRLCAAFGGGGAKPNWKTHLN